MSTNASISVVCENGTVRSIYLHCDGYPDHALATLRRSYNTPEKANELIVLGDCSSLADTLDESVFYARDKNEDWEDVQFSISDTPLEAYEKNEQQYNYFWAHGEWKEAY